MGGSDCEASRSAHRTKEKKKPLSLPPIAKPLATKKISKRTLTLIRRAAEHNCLKRGVKEVVKSIRRGDKGVCVIAGDVTPIDVIAHVPVVCKDADIPYVFVKSKDDLAKAGATQRPTSCILVLNKPTKGEIGEEALGKFKARYDHVASEVTKLAASMI